MAGSYWNTPAGHHAAEPLADVPLVKTGSRGQLLRRTRALGGGDEQPRAVADVDHVVEHRAGVDRQHLAGAGFELLRVELGSR